MAGAGGGAGAVGAATIGEWRAAALADGPKPALQALLAGLPSDDTAWITRIDAATLERFLTALAERATAVGGAENLPLYGVPFAVKDNIDVAGVPTTAACPAFAFVPEVHAASVQRLVDAGAIPIGKTNLDQFATGLNGTRSPYGAVPNTFKPEYVSGGSSAGSASVVARGLVPFALGTDTAGSGRVPAGFNNLVGLKPTRGWIGNSGMLPACRSLDCTSVFALSVDDAWTVATIAAGPDDGDLYSRQAPVGAGGHRLPATPRFAVPANPEWYGDTIAAAAWDAALASMSALGAELVTVDFGPLFEVAALLYEGPWVAERDAAVGAFLDTHAADFDPSVRAIVEGARGFSATELFKAEYRFRELRKQADALMAGVDALLVPTAPTIHTIADMQADPIRLNSQFGRYTNFVNLLDWCALALPAGFRSDGLPAGLTLIAPAWRDAALAEFGRRWQRHAPWTRGATGVALAPPAFTVESTAPAGWLRLAVVGAHLTGMPLNGQLLERGGRLVEQSTTSDAYRLYALPGTVPPKPGLIRGAAGSGAPIIVELWDLPMDSVGSFLALIGPPLGLGSIELADGRSVHSFICEGLAAQGATDITALGGWRAYIASRS